MQSISKLLLVTSLLFLSTNISLAQTSCSYIVHVTTTGTDNVGCGGEGTPCQTINYGINEAISQGIADVRVSNGTYNEIVILQSGINVWGGYDGTWTQTSTTTLNGEYSGTLNQYIAVTANGVLGGVILSDFTINAPNASTSGKSSYGIHIVGSVASELIAEAGIIMKANMKLTDIAHTVHAHPTFSETLKEAAEICLHSH